MPAQQQQEAPAGASQRAGKQFIVFEQFAKMNTQSRRELLAENEQAWLENLQPIAPNRLQAVPAALPEICNLAGATVLSEFYADLNGTDYIISFTTNGAAYQVNIAAGTVIQFAPPGTFSAPDCTTWNSERVLIADPSAGYASWDGSVFVRSGGVSPQLMITNGGTGYGAAPTVTITGGSGSGAAAVATVVAGSVVTLELTAAGSGYRAGDTLTVTFAGGGGTGAAATAMVWPIGFTGTTIAVYAGRVWLGDGRILRYTGTLGFGDTDPANAAGSTPIVADDLTHTITAVRSLNNYLFIFGDSSIRQIGNVTVSGSITNFTLLDLSSDQGTTFPLTVASYNRLVVFANKTGVYGIFGASVQKISNDLDGIYENVDFGQQLCAGLADIRGIRNYLLLLRYADPVRGTRSIVCSFQNEKWYVISQGDNLAAIVSVALAGEREVYGSSTDDITPLLADPDTAVTWIYISALTPHRNPVQGKKAIRAGFGHVVTDSSPITMTIESEVSALTYTYCLGQDIIWVNDDGGEFFWENDSGGEFTFASYGYQFFHRTVDGSGILLGATLTGTMANFQLVYGAIEYIDTALWGQGTPSLC